MIPAGNQSERAAGGGSGLYVCVAVAALGAVVTLGNAFLVLISLVALAILWFGALSSPFRVVMATCLSFQWLQATGTVWIAGLSGTDLSVPQTVFIGRDDQPFQIPTMVESAIVVALAAIVMVALGARLLGPRLAPLSPSVAEFSPSRLLVGYLALLLVSMVAGPFSGGGFAQPLIVLGSLRLAFALLLLFFWIVRRQGLIPLLVVVIVEIVVGFTGFFSGFKNIFIVLGIGLLMIRREHWARVAPALFVSLTALVVLGTVWTAVKDPYRAILSQNSGGQNITIGVTQRLQALVELIGSLEARDLADGVINLALRVSYVEYLAEVIDYVPDALPHERGELWGEAISHVLTPRILFPEKKMLRSDSERTMLYTGQVLASDDEGTSISIGYVGDSYIDFGFPGALAIPFMLGLLYALIARHILAASQAGDTTVGLAVLVVIMFPVQQFEIGSIKLFPGILWAWIVGSAAVWIVWPRVRPFFCASPGEPPTLRKDPLAFPSA
jgi:hypothetical protein